MKLMFLGTGAGVPSRHRNVSSLALMLLDELNETWLFDCGEATQHQILKTNLKPRKITKIFITHLHGDHIFGLPGLVSSRSFQGGDDPLTIYGPRGIKQYVLTSLKISRTHLSYPLNFVELDPKGGQLQFDKGWKVEYLPLDHGILSFGYRIIEPFKQGELLIDKLKQYNIPSGPIYGQLKNRQTVTLEDGTVLDGNDFVGPSIRGHVIAILGDTRPHRNAETLAKGADVLVHEATFEKNESNMAHNYFHSTTRQAALLAKKCSAKELFLTHISARYTGQACQQLLKEAKETFKNVHLVSDLDVYEIKRVEE